MSNVSYNDFLIPMGFPNWKIYLPDQWYKPILQRLGFNKDGLTGLGHSLIVMVNAEDGEIVYADFGRYCVAPTMGRARMYIEDPLLKVPFKAIIKDGQIENILEIVKWVYDAFNIHMSGGPLIYKVLGNASFDKSFALAKEFCEKGFMHYNIFGKKNSNCSRFVRSVLIEGRRPGSLDFAFRFGLITPTPVDNVFLLDRHRSYQVYENEKNHEVPQKFLDHIRFYDGKRNPGYYDKVFKEYPDRQWVDCEGIGAYFKYEVLSTTRMQLTKFDFMSNLEWSRSFKVESGNLDINKLYTVDLGDHLYCFFVSHQEEKIRLLREDKYLV